MYNEYEKGAIHIANGSPQLNVTYQKSKSNLTLVGAVAFYVKSYKQDLQFQRLVIRTANRIDIFINAISNCSQIKISLDLLFMPS